MIYVGGLPVGDPSNGSSDRLAVLMEHPFLVSSSLVFKTTAVQELSGLDGSAQGRRRRHVYVFQREYATVDPSLVDLVGTDEATTCVGIVIRNKENGMTSVAHMDSPDVVEVGLSQMVAQLGSSSDLDVHLVGGYDDNGAKGGGGGCSLPLCMKIVEGLENRRENFHIQTLFILSHNTVKDCEEITASYPVFSGFVVETSTGCIMPARFSDVVETSTGCIMPARFSEATRCPDEIVRRIRLSASCWDASCSGKLLETYDTGTDQFVIPPFSWNQQLINMALAFHQLSDEEILLTCSTSPAAEAPDFVENMRRGWDYLIRHPDWRQTFPFKKARVFKRVDDSGSGGGWTMVSKVLVTK